MGYIHRDIKVDNVLVTLDGGGMSVKLCDFSTCVKLESGILMSDFSGSDGWRSPEMELLDPETAGTSVGYGNPTDIYSAALVIVSLFGIVPQQAQEFVKSSHFDTVGPLATVVRAMLHEIPNFRPTASEILRLPHIQEKPRPVAAADMFDFICREFAGRFNDFSCISVLHMLELTTLWVGTSISSARRLSKQLITSTECSNCYSSANGVICFKNKLHFVLPLEYISSSENKSSVE
eukprot:TRINITY_DN2424_c0_g1_i1.p1 TRINITY_DN2424_c0_g1~~TRINITY_DN2424_c0_g1_i1.p1  ORF type:complete len:235 (-),score=18.43 TRINITY_DN2424_c0_g1_i1:107-811(-)